MQGDRGTAAYTNVPVGAGGTANYPASQKVSGTGGTANYPASNGVGSGFHRKSSYGSEYDGSNVNSQGYGMKSGYGNGNGGAYVQPTPVSYGPDGRPIVRRKSHRLRNAILGTLAVCCCCVAL